MINIRCGHVIMRFEQLEASMTTRFKILPYGIC